LNGNVIGRVLPDGRVVDANGNVIGSITKPGRVAVDENGNVIGVVMPDGSVVDANGNVIGSVDENGNVISNNSPLKGKKLRVAYDKDGNISALLLKRHLWISTAISSAACWMVGSIVDLNGNVTVLVGDE
jgi:YD repeat-containing protein